MKKDILSALLILTAFALGTIGCSKKEGEKGGGAHELPITVAEAETKSILLSREYPGYLQAKQTVHLTARASGTLEKMLYKPGQTVREGELLFIIEPTTYESALTEAKAALENAILAEKYAQVNHDKLTQASLADAVSEISVIQAKTQLEQAKAAVTNAKAAVKIAETNLGYCYVKAPCSGRITRNQLDVGNYINAATAPTLATIVQDDQLYVYFNVTDNQKLASVLADKKRYALRDSLQVRPGESGEAYYPAKLDYLEPSVNLSTGTITLRAITSNADGRLRDGLYVRVTLPYERAENTVLINDASIGTDQLGRFVYLVNDSNQVVYTPVEIGELVNLTQRQILKGVNPGDRYVLTALQKVQNGMKIKPVPAK